MKLLYKKIDKTYGGYDYVEVDTEARVYAKGCSRAHRGHGKGRQVIVEVSRKRDLTNVMGTLALEGYDLIKNMYLFETEDI